MPSPAIASRSLTADTVLQWYESTSLDYWVSGCPIPMCSEMKSLKFEATPEAGAVILVLSNTQRLKSINQVYTILSSSSGFLFEHVISISKWNFNAKHTRKAT
jgi:hypothetical protein